MAEGEKRRAILVTHAGEMSPGERLMRASAMRPSWSFRAIVGLALAAGLALVVVGSVAGGWWTAW